MTGDNQPPPHIHSVLPSISISISIADAAAMYANGTDLKDPYLSPGASVCVFLARPPPPLDVSSAPPVYHLTLPFPSLPLHIPFFQSTGIWAAASPRASS